MIIAGQAALITGGGGGLGAGTARMLASAGARVAILDNSTAGIECLMHQVPVISTGWPEYHWVTEKLQVLPQLPRLIKDLEWHELDDANKFIYWYIHDYLCYDVESTKRRLKDILDSWRL